MSFFSNLPWNSLNILLFAISSSDVIMPTNKKYKDWVFLKLSRFMVIIVLGSDLIKEGKCKTEIWTRNEALRQNPEKQKVFVEKQKKMRDFYVISALLYGSGRWTISKRMRRKMTANNIWLYRRMMNIPWTKRANKN